MLYHEENYEEAKSMSSTAPVLNIANADDEDIMLQESEGETSFYNCRISNSISFVLDPHGREGNESSKNDVSLGADVIKSDSEADNDNNGDEANSGNVRQNTGSMPVYARTQVKNIDS